MRRTLFGRVRRTALIALLLALPTWSLAAFEETDGIRFGAFSLHPSAYTAIRYVDNIYFVPSDYEPLNEGSVPQGIESDFILNIQPGVLLRLRVPTFTAQAAYKFYNDNYLGTDDPDNRHALLNASNHTASGLLDYQSPVGVFVTAQDTYTAQEAFEPSDVYVDYIVGDQDHNEALGRLGYKYGPETNLYISGEYKYATDRYELAEESDRDLWFGIGDLRLKFFPRTSLVFQGGHGEITYLNNEDSNSVVNFGLGGLVGQITPHIQAIAKGGYQTNEYQDGESGAGFIGNAEIGGVWEPNMRVAVGYKRSFIDAATTNFYTSDEGYLTFYRLWRERLATEAYLSYQSNEFSRPFDRHEDFVQARLELTLRMIFWLYTGAGYQYDNKAFDDGDIQNTTERNIVFVKLVAQF